MERARRRGEDVAFFALCLCLVAAVAQYAEKLASLFLHFSASSERSSFLCMCEELRRLPLGARVVSEVGGRMECQEKKVGS